jgi:osmotically-inducible protein OsmY
MSTSTLVQSRAAHALRHSSIPAIRNLSIEETDEFVLIQGNVVSYYLKQLAQETVMSVLDGRELRNRVTVQRSRSEANQ